MEKTNQSEIMVRLEAIFDEMHLKAMKGARFESIYDALESLRLSTKYMMFDLEATRRERDARRK